MQDGGLHVDLQELQAARKAAQVGLNAMIRLFPSLLLFRVSENSGKSRVGRRRDRGIGWLSRWPRRLPD